MTGHTGGKTSHALRRLETFYNAVLIFSGHGRGQRDPAKAAAPKSGLAGVSCPCAVDRHVPAIL